MLPAALLFGEDAFVTDAACSFSVFITLAELIHQMPASPLSYSVPSWCLLSQHSRLLGLCNSSHLIYKERW